ncbi:delta-6-desaturase [Halteromyces radiatus]|uniref:delta-6-desaturase n=1 Tax=Halteromyces radiatus TaxID=101107 RepID=UPI00221FEDFE|nr:delta-6-desaturase [Halteromyces radiatus]KAI8096504.1 delta-6-desaturase [Halteromyces radiatus]
MSGQATDIRVFERQELSKSLQAYKDGNTEEKKFLTIDNKVYDITDFIADHPGGEQVISTHIGKDATDVFHAMHPKSAYETLANCYVGDLAPEKNKTQDKEKQNSQAFAQEIRELRDKLTEEGYFDSSTLYYTYKVLSTVSICAVGLAMLYFGGHSTPIVFAAAVIIGLFWQQCGWLAHDFGHHQVSDDHDKNDMLVIFLGCFCQGFSLSWWKNKHNTHHASTNVSGHDPDIDTAPILLWDEFATANFYGSLEDNPGMISRFIAEHVLPYQSRYYFFILGFARFSWAVQSLMYSFNQGTLNKSATLNWMERSMLVSHWILFTTWTIMFIDSFTNMIMFFLVSQAVTGYALAFVFAMNHNGMPVISQEQAEDMEFYEIQVITGRAVTLSALGDWFFGGLNYQIEHHVFPDMPRHNLPKVKPMIKSICKKYNIHYHDTTALKGTLEVLQTLDVVQKLCGKFSKKVF